jgi:trk system potassium uptake protein TrkH
VTAGGIGYPVLLEMWRRATRPRDSHTPLRWSLQTRLTIGVSAILLVTGALTLGVLGTGGDGGWGAAAFHSVSARTAGFNTVVMSSLPGASLVVLILLMFIGGSPGSCAGGIKTTTIAVWLAHLRARLRGTSAVRVLDRTVADALVDQAETLVALSILWNVAGVAILSATESAHLHATLRDIVFEQVSAFGTVGLSTGLTGSLSSAGKMWITLSMFIGRLGPLVVAMSLVAKKRSNVQYPSGRLMIG